MMVALVYWTVWVSLGVVAVAAIAGCLYAMYRICKEELGIGEDR